MPFTHADLANCAEREVHYRRRTYARLVFNKKMTQAKADKEIAMMEAIAAHFAELARRERLV